MQFSFALRWFCELIWRISLTLISISIFIHAGKPPYHKLETFINSKKKIINKNKNKTYLEPPKVRIFTRKAGERDNEYQRWNYHSWEQWSMGECYQRNVLSGERTVRGMRPWSDLQRNTCKFYWAWNKSEISLFLEVQESYLQWWNLYRKVVEDSFVIVDRPHSTGHSVIEV